MKRARSGNDDAKPQKQNIEIAEPNAEINMTLVTLVRSVRADKRTMPGTEAVFISETSNDDSMGERLIVRAYDGIYNPGMKYPRPCMTLPAWRIQNVRVFTKLKPSS